MTAWNRLGESIREVEDSMRARGWRRWPGEKPERPIAVEIVTEAGTRKLAAGKLGPDSCPVPPVWWRPLLQETGDAGTMVDLAWRYRLALERIAKMREAPDNFSGVELAGGVAYLCTPLQGAIAIADEALR